MKRSKHSLSHYKLLSCDMGQLIPVACYDVLPGDSIQQASSALIRVSPLLAPVMHPVQVRIHHWFVPNRLVWDGWEDFITGGADGEGGDAGAFPTFEASGSSWVEGGLADYLGVVPGYNGSVSQLPFRAYNLIFNEFYRDQDLVAEVTNSTMSGQQAINIALQNISWEKDYFTTARPWPQKGPEVTLPLGTTADVVYNTDNTLAARLRRADNRNVFTTGEGLSAEGTSGNLINDADTIPLILDPNGTLEVDLATASAVDVNTVRLAFALQRYQEARAQYGSRYTEYLRYLGVRSSDARLQRPEYLGGGKQTVSFSEVLQTAPTTDGDDTEGVGNLRGHGIAAMRSRRFRRFFEEHGHVISLMSVRPKTMYGNGLHRHWSKRTKEDFWQKELELIGQQELYNREVYAADTGPDDVFGYQDRYAEYRHFPSSVSGEFRSTLNYWHMARIFAGDVTLNGSFVTSDPTKRINAVQTNDVLWCMVNHSIQARRMVRKSAGVGRII